MLTTTTYGAGAGEPSEHFISCVQKGNVTACQFHPEKSGKVKVWNSVSVSVSMAVFVYMAE